LPCYFVGSSNSDQIAPTTSGEKVSPTCCLHGQIFVYFLIVSINYPGAS